LSDINTLVADVFKLLEGNEIVSPKVFEKFSHEMGLVLRSRLTPEERVPSLRMSNVGRPLRQLWYELNGYKGEDLSGPTRMKFLYGHVLECLVIALSEAAGHTVERLQEEVSVDGVLGHIDCVISGTLVDVKSCSPYSFKKFQDGTLLEPGNDPFGYVGQISGYAHEIKLPAAWIAINKVTGDLCVLHVPQEYIDEYDIRKKIKEAQNTVASKEEPPRCCEPTPVSKTDKSGNLVLPAQGSYCAWKQYCNRNANEGKGLKTYVYSTGPKFFTTIIKEPRVQPWQKEFE